MRLQARHRDGGLASFVLGSPDARTAAGGAIERSRRQGGMSDDCSADKTGRRNNGVSPSAKQLFSHTFYLPLTVSSATRHCLREREGKKQQLHISHRTNKGSKIQYSEAADETYLKQVSSLFRFCFI